MKPYPAIATLEFRGIAAGIQVTDAMVKKAPIALLKSGVISGGRFLALLAGSTASVEEAYQEGCYWAGADLLDHVWLPDVDPVLYQAIMGTCQPCRDGASVGLLETDTVSGLLQATERVLKGTPVELGEVRLADAHLHGKGISCFNGELHDVEAALDLAVQVLETRPHGFSRRILTAPSAGLLAQLNQYAPFGAVQATALKGE